jgi:hypothetical protein
MRPGGYEDRAVNVKDTPIGPSSFLILRAILVAWIMIVGIFVFRMMWLVWFRRAEEIVLQWTFLLSWVGFGVIVFLFLPLAIPKATRVFSILALLIASFMFGAILWMANVVVTLGT